MTKEEIIQNVSIQTTIEGRGVRIDRKGMCSCPFHVADRHPSMKIYKNSFYCFACGARGNVIDFVMEYDHVDFKTAFIALGGTYKTQTEAERKVAELSRQRAKADRERKEKAEAEFKKELGYCMALAREACKVLEPMSEEWCFFQDILPKLESAWTCKYEKNEEVNELDVIRMCRQTRQRIAAIT